MQRQYLDIKNTINITSDLKEAITLLKYSYLEIENYINQKIQENPFLSFEEENDGSKNDEKQDQESITSLEDEVTEVDFDNYSSAAIYNNFDDVNNGIENYSDRSKNDFLENTESFSVSLKEFLIEQISLVFNDNKEKLIATYLVDFVDENGYFEKNFLETAKTDLKCKKCEIEKIILQLQALEPIGVFARSLIECLTIQLKHKNLYNHQYKNLLLNIELLGNGQFDKLIKILKISQDNFFNLMNEIKKLNPKPGLSFNKSNTITLIPDIILHLKNNDYTIELNSNYRNNIRVDKEYYQKIRNKIGDQISKESLQEMYNSARSIINSLTHRDQNLYLVTNAIISKQLKFFTHGINHFIPLSLTDIANETSLSISTVSRVVTNKYIATPMGTFKLRYFFSSSTKGDALSSKYIKSLIKKIIDSENIALSDQDIVLKLQQLNIKLSRRAVTKYRESMNIPSSIKRKKIDWRSYQKSVTLK